MTFYLNNSGDTDINYYIPRLRIKLFVSQKAQQVITFQIKRIKTLFTKIFTFLLQKLHYTHTHTHMIKAKHTHLNGNL